MINPEIIELIQSRLSLTITGTKPVSGGDINAVYCLQTGTGGKLLLKLNSARCFPNIV
jgi:fructosamine-3-kinase